MCPYLKVRATMAVLGSIYVLASNLAYTPVGLVMAATYQTHASPYLLWITWPLALIAFVDSFRGGMTGKFFGEGMRDGWWYVMGSVGGYILLMLPWTLMVSANGGLRFAHYKVGVRIVSLYWPTGYAVPVMAVCVILYLISQYLLVSHFTDIPRQCLLWMLPLSVIILQSLTYLLCRDVSVILGIGWLSAALIMSPLGRLTGRLRRRESESPSAADGARP